MFSTKYSVSDVANMLRVNEETVRRWIRDGKLKANSAKGRGGNTIYINDVVDFVNKPPREYLLPLETWLTDNNISYITVEANEETDDRKNMNAIATGGAVTAAAVTTAAVKTSAVGLSAAASSMAIPFVGPAVAGVVASTVAARQLIKKKKSKNCPNYIIVLCEAVADEYSNKTENIKEVDHIESRSEDLSDNHEEKDTVSETEQNEAQNISEDAQTATSVLDEISRAKQMVDMGIITEEEFAEIKIKLIAKL